MSSNVLALEPVRALHHAGKPDRAEVEAAVQTIIRWSGDSPDRDGLIETPARVARVRRGLRRLHTGSDSGPAKVIRRDRKYPPHPCATLGIFFPED